MSEVAKLHLEFINLGEEHLLITKKLRDLRSKVRFAAGVHLVPLFQLKDLGVFLFQLNF